MVSVGTIVWLSSELMFFAALFAAYFTVRSVTPELWAQETVHLNIPFASVNTTILVLSSLTCQMGVFAAERGQVGRTGSVFQMKGWGLREWFVLTYVMGAIFIGGQALEYAELIHAGVTIPSSLHMWSAMERSMVAVRSSRFMVGNSCLATASASSLFESVNSSALRIAFTNLRTVSGSVRIDSSRILMVE